MFFQTFNLFVESFKFFFSIYTFKPQDVIRLNIHRRWWFCWKYLSCCGSFVSAAWLKMHSNFPDEFVSQFTIWSWTIEIIIRASNMSFFIWLRDLAFMHLIVLPPHSGHAFETGATRAVFDIATRWINSSCNWPKTWQSTHSVAVYVLQLQFICDNLVFEMKPFLPKLY